MESAGLLTFREGEITKRVYLPDEIIVLIVDKVFNVKTLLAMMQTCKRFYSIVTTSFLAIDTILNAFWEKFNPMGISSFLSFDQQGQSSLTSTMTPLAMRIVDICHIRRKRCIVLTCIPFSKIHDDVEITIVTPKFVFGKMSVKISILPEIVHQIETKDVYICISTIGNDICGRESIMISMFF